MAGLLKKIKLNIVLFFHGLFHGLRAADSVMSSQVSGEEHDGLEVSHKLEIDSVYNDLLRERQTQDVQELVDMSYRVAREADKYEVTLIGDIGDDSVGSDKELKAVAVKKVAMRYDKHPEVFNEGGYHVTLIQDNKKFPKKSNMSATISDFANAINTNGLDCETTIDLKYDGFTPRFAIQNYITKLVIREGWSGKKRVDLYLPSEAGQFTKTDAILIAELHRIMDDGTKKTDFLDIQALSFVTDKAYGSDDYVLYDIGNLKLNKISLFDGSFVLTFEPGRLVLYDIVEAHKTESLTRKYDGMEPRKDGISIEDVGAIERRDKKLAKLGPERNNA